MSERLRSMSEEDLGLALAGLDLDWPPEPDLAERVMRGVRAQPRVARLPMRRSRRIMLIAAAIVLLLAGAAVAAKIVIDLGAVVVEVGPRPSSVPSPTAAPLGERITLREARDLLGDEVPFPGRLGRPNGIWADHVFTDAGDVVRISAVWKPGGGLPAIPGTRYGAILMRFEGDTDQAFKDVFEDTGRFEPVTFDGIDGYWLTGRHVLRILTSDGMSYVTIEGNVLLWRDGSYTMRLETSLPQREAFRIAASIPR
jgi:hypothetical protein